MQAQIDVVDAQIAARWHRLLDAGRAAESRRQRQALAAKYASLISIAGQAELAKLARQQTMDVVQAADEAGRAGAALRRFATPPSVAALGLLIGLAVVALRLRSRDTLTTSEDLADRAPRSSVRDVDTVPSPPITSTKRARTRSTSSTAPTKSARRTERFVRA